MGYNNRLGEPALLMPDPDKDPARESGVRELWTQFRKALKSATHVLVAGHSLYDGKLVAEIQNALDRGASVGVTYFASGDDSEDTGFVHDALNTANPHPCALRP